MARVRPARSKRTTAAVGLSTEAPQSLEDLRPWLLEVLRAKRRGMHIRRIVHIARLTKPGAEWRWTVACTAELMNIVADSRVAYPVNGAAGTISVVNPNSVGAWNSESQGRMHPSWFGGGTAQG